MGVRYSDNSVIVHLFGLLAFAEGFNFVFDTACQLRNFSGIWYSINKQGRFFIKSLIGKGVLGLNFKCCYNENHSNCIPWPSTVLLDQTVLELMGALLML